MYFLINKTRTAASKQNIRSSITVYANNWIKGQSAMKLIKWKLNTFYQLKNEDETKTHGERERGGEYEEWPTLKHSNESVQPTWIASTLSTQRCCLILFSIFFLRFFFSLLSLCCHLCLCHFTFFFCVICPGGRCKCERMSVGKYFRQLKVLWNEKLQKCKGLG